MKKRKEVQIEEKAKKQKLLYNPMKMTEALKEMGENYTKKEAALYYIAVLIIALILCFFFELEVKYMAVVAGVYLFFVPQLFYNQRKRAFELRRFRDVNAYMSQMAQSFTGNGNILHSLRETGSTFPAGRMHDAIQRAISSIENGPFDIREAEQQAYRHIEEGYSCEKLLNLHSFLLTAESRGGECATEFGILERTRSIWEKAVSDYHRKLLFDRNVGVLLYGIMLGVCVFVMKSFPESLSIIQISFVQLVNVIMLISFIIFFVVLDMRLNTSLLKETKPMSKERVESYYTFIKEYDSKKERRKYILYPVMMGILVTLWYITSPEASVLAIGMILFIVTLNLHKITLALTIWTVKSELKKAFPKWLFDVMLLIQRDSVESAIFKSVEKAPPILRPELARISNMLAVSPKNADAYISFLADFNIMGVEPAMRKLYSLAVGTGGDIEVMKVIIESNMTLLSEAEERSIAQKGDMSALVNFIPMFVVSLGMIVYCAALVMVSLSRIWSIFD